MKHVKIKDTLGTGLVSPKLTCEDMERRRRKRHMETVDTEFSVQLVWRMGANWHYDFALLRHVILVGMTITRSHTVNCSLFLPFVLKLPLLHRQRSTEIQCTLLESDVDRWRVRVWGKLLQHQDQRDTTPSFKPATSMQL